MGLLNLPRIPRGASVEQMANIYNMAIEEMEHRVNGFLQSSNIQEVGGWQVGQTELQSKDKDVGMSTADDGADPTRLWAGGTDKDTAPWRVTQAGKMHATGATIETSAGYPKIVIDPSGNLIGVYLDALNYIELVTSFGGGAPAIMATVDGNTAYQLIADNGGVSLVTGAKSLTIGTNVQGHVYILPEIGYNVYITGWEYFVNQGTGVDLLTELISKATAGANTGSAGSATLNGGIPVGTQLAVNGGGFVTWAGINVPSHTHTQT